MNVGEIQETTPPVSFTDLSTAPMFPSIKEEEGANDNGEHAIMEIHTMRSSTSTTQDDPATSQVVPKKRKALELANDFDEEDDESDDEDDSDDEGDGEPHDPNSEPLPKLPIYEPSFKKVEELCQGIIHRFREFLSNNEYKDEEVKIMLDEVEKLKEPPYHAASIRVGLIGDAGVGKSSLLSSILGIENISVQGDDGESCTYVAQEFTHKTENQKSPFEAEIEFFSRDICLKMMEDHLKDCEKYFLPSDKVQDEYKDDADDLSLKVSTAIDVFMALFCDKDEFAEKDLVQEFLAEEFSMKPLTIFSDFRIFTKFILEELVPDSQIRHLYSPTSNGLTEQVLPFTKTVPFPVIEGTSLKTCPWPFVKLVRIRLQSRILEQGIVLADLPGVTDTNRTRVKTTRAYLQKCDYSMVVGRIDRCKSDIGIHKHISDGFRRRRSGSVMLIITRSDDISKGLSKTIQLKTSDEIRYQEYEDEAKTLSAKIEDLKRQMHGAKKKKKYALAEKKNAYETRKKLLDMKRDQIRILARNETVMQGLKENYKSLTKDKVELPVFCVSNSVYMDHVRGYDFSQPPPLSLQDTDIPRLREYLYALPSKGKFATLQHYCSGLLMGVLNTMELSCSVSKLKRKDNLDQIVHQAHLTAVTKANAIFNNFSRNSTGRFVTKIRAEENKWCKQGRKQFEIWSKTVNPTAHRAFVKKNGIHTIPTPKGGGTGPKTASKLENWNETLLKPVCEELDPIFDHILMHDCAAVAEEMGDTISQCINKMDRTLQDDPSASLCGAVTIFRENIKLRKKDIQLECEKLAANFQKAFNAMQEMSTMDGDGHFFTKAMKKVYEDALKAKAPKTVPKTLHAGRCKVLDNAFSAIGGPYREIANGIELQGPHGLGILQERFIKQIDDHFRQMQKDFDLSCSTKEDDSDEAKRFRLELHGMVAETKDLLRTTITDLLENARNCRG